MKDIEATPPPQPIRVLIMDDNPLDAELEARELQAAIPCVVRTATRESEFRAALAESTPDVILCDFAFPDFDGLTALELAKELAPGVPLIFVSGTIGEERAVVAVRHGAVDYVLKQHRARLPHAVTRAVDEARDRARRQRIERELDALRDRIEALLENVDSALSSFSLSESRYYYFSPGAQRVYGRPPEDFYRDDSVWFEFIHPEDAQLVREGRDRMLAEGGLEMEYRVVHPDGSIRWVNHRSKVVYDVDGTPLRVDTVGTDVTQRKQHERQLQRLGRIRDVFAALNAAVVRITDRTLLCEEACRIATEIGGFSAAGVFTVDLASGEGHVEATAGAIPPGDAEFVATAAARDPDHAPGYFAESMRAGSAVVANDVRSEYAGSVARDKVYATGTRAMASFPFVIDDAHKGALMLGATEVNFFSTEESDLIAAVSKSLGFALELAAKRERLDYLAYYDPLTDLPNRRLAEERVALEIHAAQRRGDRVALLLADVRQLTYVNTALGAASGDEALRQLATRLREHIGPTRVARAAGDRFAIIIPEVRAIGDVTSTLSSEGLALLAEPIVVRGRQLRVTARIGCAVYPDDANDAATLFRNAEAALQSAKASDAPYRFYSPELNLRFERRLDLEARLRRAAAEREFTLYYQPKVDLSTREIVGVEALMRWRDPEHPNTLVTPGEFIPVLEETGLIVDVGAWALSEAVRQHHAWLEAGLRAPRVAVNVSPVQLRDGRLIEDVERALAQFPDESGIDVEVTESGVMASVTESIETLKRVRALDVGIALDDFGTGYSSLSYIFQMPMTMLKIDRSFVNGITTEADKLTVVSTVISLAHQLRLPVVAEGVETEDQAKLLQLVRCDQIQGFLIGRPMPAAELAQRLTPSA